MTRPSPPDEAFDRALLDDDPQELYDHAPCGYLSTTPDGTIVKVNATFLAWTGYTADELVGRRTFSSLLSPGGRIYHDTHYAPMLQMQQHVREIALEVVRAGGDRLPILLNASLARDASGRPQVIRIVVFDATERREYERELLRAKQRAEESESRSRSLTRTLQQTLVPPSPPEIPGLVVNAVYRPAGTGEEVGGDFYDIFQIADDDWVVVLGDVCGKGVEAAVVTALVRYSVRSVTVRMPQPTEALRNLNDVLLRHPSGRFCTVALLRLTRASVGWQLTMSLGGHPQPLLLRSGSGKPSNLGTAGSLVGVLDEPDFTETTIALAPGDCVVIYTDGVTEGRRGREQYGEHRLRATVARHAQSPTAIPQAVLADVLDFQGGTARDDIAVVSVGVPRGAGE